VSALPAFDPAPGASVRVRPATAADGAARCALFARVGMAADVVLSVRREPDFDALYRLQSTSWQSLVVEVDGEVEGVATLLVRDGWVDGRVRRVGYLGDLRLSPRAEGRHLLDRHFAPVLADASRRFGCEHWLTSVIASNARALRALTVRTERAARAGRPSYVPLHDFAIRSVHLLPPRLRRPSRYRVRRATEADVPALARLLDDDARRRPYGYVFTERELRRRLTEWPGLHIGSFYLAEDAAGAPAGCVAPWDATPVKRTIVTDYRGAMLRVRLGYDLAALLFRMPRLPPRGHALRYLYLTHQAVPSDDAEVLRALLEAVYADARGRGWHFLSACAPAGDPLEPAYRGFFFTDLPARLYRVVAAGCADAPRESPGGRHAFPGFEMALV
jgi:hypothetical protein